MRRTPNTSTSLALLAAAVLLHACAPAPGDPSSTRVASEIETMLHQSAEAWNQGDLDGFLDDYAPDATFVGATGLIRGRDQIRQRYMDGFWSSGMPADALRFTILEVRPVGTTAAVAVGRYELYGRETGTTNSSGTFSLTLHRAGDQWKILHDHSSADAE